MEWHNLSSDEALQSLNSSRSGLSDTEAKSRLFRYGANELKGKKKIPPIVVFLRQFLSPSYIGSSFFFLNETKVAYIDLIVVFK